MKTLTIDLTEDQLKQVDEFMSESNTYPNYICIAQLRIKDRHYSRTHVKVGILTGEIADESTKLMNEFIQAEKEKSNQRGIEI